MLAKLEFDNFFSFRDPQAIDLRAIKGASDPDHRLAPVFPGSDDHVPKVIAFFGSNASGKTSVLRALAFLAWFIKDSFQILPEGALLFEPFMDEGSADRMTRLSAEFGGILDSTREAGPDNPVGLFRYDL